MARDDTPASRPNRRTTAVHGGIRRSQYGEVAEAIFLTQGFVYPDAEAAEARFQKAGPDEFIYARYGNPTVRMFEDRMAALEGTEDAFAAASGMAAVSGTLLAMCRAGDHIVSSRALFGSCLYVLEEVLVRYGVEVTFVDGTDLAQWQTAVRPGATKAVFFETISNPALEVVDIAAVARIAHAAGAMVLVDNVFATPTFSRAVDLGALGTRDFIRKTVEPYMKHTGGAMSPFTAWLMLNGLATMDLRVRAQTAAATRLATALSGHGKLARVIYPGLPSHPQHAVARAQMEAGGTVLSIDIAGGKDAAFRFLNALRVFTISNNLGDAKSIVTHPATTTHQRLPEDQKAHLGITPGLVRLSVGLEDDGDLLADVMQALDAA
ncbi:MAG: aminotransferase class I/II-fold pyridoxal phosphate-dependent enzyme [Rhodobacteraceae bacterium]|nr:aminotransferase class I/II-fold pyridoxal phosphate-dependent enzyme [Paracoccaceae bacterium]